MSRTNAYNPKNDVEIAINNVSVVFKDNKGNDVKALDNVDFDIHKGEFISLLGPSGCGKTTLLNSIGGLDQYTDGDLIINGVSTKKYNDRDWDTYRNHSVGFVFQSFNLIPKLTAEENVELPLIYQGVRKAERDERVQSALRRVKLEARAKHFPAELSGGQQQRVAIARAIVTRPSLILADEPTGNLDSRTTAEIMDIFHELHGQGNTIVLITHDNSVAAQTGRRIHILDGKLTEEER